MELLRWRIVSAMTNPFLPPRNTPPPSPTPAEAVMAEVHTIHAEAVQDGPPVEDLVAAARQAKRAKEDATAEYERLRSELWAAVSKTPGKIGKTTARFSAPSSTGKRSTDYALLASEYPDAYEAAVKVSEPDLDAAGRLYL